MTLNLFFFLSLFRIRARLILWQVMSFNSPIGYSKNPILDEDVTEEIDPYNIKKTNGKSRLRIGSLEAEEKDEDKDKSGGMRLEDLPIEILELILLELSQFDLLNLMRTNSLIYNKVHPKLYENIIIDANFSGFNKEFGTRQSQRINNGVKKFNNIYINSTYNFKKFLTNYKPIRPIYRFQCNCLPDSITIITKDLEMLILKVFGQLDHLQELIWHPSSFNLNYLCHLPTTLTALIINGKHFSGFQHLLRFNQLHQFHIDCYSNEENLDILTNVLHQNQTTLTRLQLGKHPVDHYNEIPLPPSDELLAPELHLVPRNEYPLNEFNRIFHSTTTQYPHVTQLSLAGIFVNELDFDCLNESVQLQNISHLQLRHLVEYKTNQQSSFLVRLAPKLSSLKYLLLDHRESNQDNVPYFLLHINKLIKLNLIVRQNETKTFSEALYEEALQHHESTLTHLAINLKRESWINFAEYPLNLNAINLSRLKQLQSIKFNGDNETNNLALIEQLPNLTHLHLFGLKAGGAPNLGLGMIHPNIFDEWFKVQHVAHIYYNHNKHLKYVKINNCLFECQDKVIPRDGIDYWFKDIVE